MRVATFFFLNKSGIVKYLESTRILARYQACHVTYQLKKFSMSFKLAEQSQKMIQKPAWLLVDQAEIISKKKFIGFN